MAVGMVSSQTNAQPVIRAGERLASTQQAIADKNAKIYKHMVPGAKFVMPDGLELVFMGGRFVTSDPELIAELDKVANKVTSMIFTEDGAAQAVKTAQGKAASDAADTAGKTTE
jgi:hypothetical protein